MGIIEKVQAKKKAATERALAGFESQAVSILESLFEAYLSRYGDADAEAFIAWVREKLGAPAPDAPSTPVE
jgi:hypothetical protein